MIRALLRKEFEEHGIAIGLLLLLETLLLALFMVLAARGRYEKSALDAVIRFLWIGGIGAAATAGHFLVATEYTGRTQLFLDALPVPRSTVLAVKLALMSGLVLFFHVLGVGCALVVSWRVTSPDAWFVTILFVRAASHGLFLSALCFTLNLLGRYRLLGLLTLLMGAAILDSHTAVEIKRFGPLALVDETFSSERQELPWRAVAECTASAAGLALAGLLIAQTQEGSVAAAMAQKMSQREKAFVALAILTTIVGLAVADSRKEPPPYDLKASLAREGDGVSVRMTSDARDGPRIQAFVDALHAELVALRKYLGVSSLPAVRIVYRSELGPRVFPREHPKHASGLVLRANPFAPGWSDARFRSWLVRELLRQQTRGRAGLDDARWVLDGFGEYWTHRNRGGQGLAAEPELLRRALYGTPHGLEPARLTRWLRFREDVGDDVAAAVGWSGLQVLAQLAGPDAVRRFAADVLGERLPEDARGTWRAWRRPTTRRLREATGRTPDELIAAWTRALQEEATRHARAPARRLTARLDLQPLSESSYRVGYAVVVEPPPPSGTRIEFRYLPLPDLGDEIDPDRVRIDDQPYPLPPDVAEIPEAQPRGSRLAWTFVLWDPDLSCEVVSGWRREIVR